ncbi:beta-microseminoprotein-like [Oncorhynchus nerka]|uniref:beta-microseminoprotein-like n=1 Tax=Oncorhynchus nerka TaxID=8023 RepID=UPI001130B7F3|nr:beta-microseminoprotein-like [Oncorhynchus nerka]
MGSLVRVVVCVLMLVVVCRAQCFFQELETKDPKTPAKGCVDKEGKQHVFGSSWVKDCYDCSCSVRGIGCCNRIPEVVDLSAECELVVDRKACSHRVVMKSDKTKDCNRSFSMVL